MFGRSVRRRSMAFAAAAVTTAALASVAITTLGNSAANASPLCGSGYNFIGQKSNVMIQGINVGNLSVTWSNSAQANCAVLYLHQSASVSLEIQDATSGPKPISGKKETDASGKDSKGNLIYWSSYAGPVYAKSNNCLEYKITYQAKGGTKVSGSGTVSFACGGSSSSSGGSSSGGSTGGTTTNSSDKTLQAIESDVNTVNADYSAVYKLVDGGGNATAMYYSVYGKNQGGSQGLTNSTAALDDVNTAMNLVNEAKTSVNNALANYKAEVKSAPGSAAISAANAGKAKTAAGEALGGAQEALPVLRLAYTDGVANRTSSASTLASEKSYLSIAKSDLSNAQSNLGSLGNDYGGSGKN